MSTQAGPNPRPSWLWIPAPLPMACGVIAALLGPEGSERFAPDLLLLLVFELWLPALALMAVLTMRAGDPRRDDLWRAAAVVTAAAGGVVGVAVSASADTAFLYAQASAQLFVTLTVPMLAGGWFARRVLVSGRAPAWAGLATLVIGVGILVTLVLFEFGWAMAPRLGAVGGGALALICLTLALVVRRRPLASSVMIAVLAASSLAIFVSAALADAAALQRFRPRGMLDQDSGGGTVLVTARAPRGGFSRLLMVDLDSGAIERLPRATQTSCYAARGHTALRFGGPLERLTGWRAGASLRATDGTETITLQGSTAESDGRLICSPATAHALWLDGPTVTAWDLDTGNSTTMTVDHGAIAYPCFTGAPLGVLYRIDSGETSPLPRRYMPLQDNPPRETAAEIDELRCREEGDAEPAMLFRRPLLHSGDPWTIETPDGGSLVVEEHPLEVTYAHDGRVAVLVADETGRWITIWQPGVGVIQRWAVDDLSRTAISPDGDHVLLVQYSRGLHQGGHWRVHRTTDGALVARGGTSDVRWSDTGALVEIVDETLLRHDLAAGTTDQLLPR